MTFGEAQLAVPIFELARWCYEFGRGLEGFVCLCVCLFVCLCVCVAPAGHMILPGAPLPSSEEARWGLAFHGQLVSTDTPAQQESSGNSGPVTTGLARDQVVFRSKRHSHLLRGFGQPEKGTRLGVASRVL